MSETWTNIISFIIAPFATALAGWAVGSRKYKAEASSTELTNVQSALGIYNEMLKDLKEKLDELTAKYDALTEENAILKSKLSDAHQDNMAMKYRLANMEQSLKDLKSNDKI